MTRWRIILPAGLLYALGGFGAGCLLAESCLLLVSGRSPLEWVG